MINGDQNKQQQIVTPIFFGTQQQHNIQRRNSANLLSGQNNSNSTGGTSNTNGANNSSCNSNSGSNLNNGGNNNSGVGLVGGGTSAAAAKNQLEQLNTMREALFSQDGWGCQHVNQDTNWEVPSSPEPANKDSSGGPPLWKPTVNNGTDLWESNLRNGGQPPTQTIQKTPWGHTPSSNLGGTWGEDDDGADSSSVWTGSSNNPPSNSNVGVSSVGGTGMGSGSGNSGPQWGQSNVGGVNTNANTSGATTNNISGVTTGSNSSSGVNVSGGANTGNTGGNQGNSWGDPRELRSGPMVGPMDMRNVDPRDPMRAASAGDPRDLRMIDPRDPIRGDPRGISGRLNGTSEMWGQHHPIAHTQIPGINKMVGPGVTAGGNVGASVVSSGSVAGLGQNVGSMNASAGVGNINPQWGTTQPMVGPKDIIAIPGKQSTGWEEPSPPPQRRNVSNYDDGTSLWGQQVRVPVSSTHWKDISDPLNRNHLMRGTISNQNASNSVVPGLGGNGTSCLGSGQTAGVGGPGGVNPNNHIGVGPQARLSAVGPPQLKPDNTMWGVHPNNTGRNPNSWGDDGNHSVVSTTGNWVDEKNQQMNTNIGNANSWNDSSSSWNKNQNKISTNPAGWVTAGTNENNDLNTDWSTHNSIAGKPHQKLGGVNVSSEMIKQSKPYRILVEAGFKKEDVERVLISGNISTEEAAEILRSNASIALDNGGWRRHDDALGSYAEHANNPGAGGSFHGRYPTAGTQPTMSFPPNNLLNNMGAVTNSGSNQPNLAPLNSMQPLQMKNFMNQVPHNISGAGQSLNAATAVAFGQTGNVTTVNAVSNSNNAPSAQQLRMLVQQIQLAVQSGYLSSQILNQPLAPATLILLNQLLSNIKHLQGAQQSLSRSNNLQINVAIAKYKQQIQNLQNQINTQQAIYIKQQQTLQQSSQHPVAHVANTNTEYLRGQHDAINALQSNFSEISLNKTSGYQSTPNQQSRLNQWKLPVLEKDITNDSTDFSRAPGATKQSLTSTANVNNMVTLGLQNDGTWSTGRNIGDGWPDSNNDENKDWSVAQSTSATAYTDLVQEFEPGKPWKGSQIKNIEDDPSITPGSVARSPLSINPTPKEADIFANASKNSPTDLPPLSLTSSTWSFNPAPNSQNFSTWSDNNQQCSTSELWSTPMNKASRGPPPGLGTNKNSNGSGVSIATNPNAVSGNSNGWLGSGVRGVPNVNTNWVGTNTSWNTNWLLIKNLTTQIDGSTLRTLCMQHGPLNSFHLYLNQGIALCKYATREEANKAQMTLNNCTLGNTTICVETPSESEVQSILQHLPQSSSNTNVASNNGSGGSSVGGGNGIVATNVSSGNVCNAAVNPIVSVASNSALNGSGSSATTCAQVTSASACNVNGNNNGNSSSGNSNIGVNSNAATSAGQSANWRQTQQNQARPPGRETDFDYISKYVCSIVDD